MIEGENLDNAELPGIEILDSGTVENEFDLKGQIEALKSEKEALESKYNELDTPRIEALGRQIMELEERLRSSE
jgi:polyhydroxyalkanoate synthesis regulator phasin